MSGRDPIEPLAEPAGAGEICGAVAWAGIGVEVREVAALANEGRTPMLIDPSRPGGPAIAARSIVDLHGAHVGASVVVAFERGDPTRPIVIGILQGEVGWPLAEPAASVEATADGERLVVSAKSQLVLRCGKASITLTKAGKVLVEGSYVLTRSTGANRIKGGSVQIN